MQYVKTQFQQILHKQYTQFKTGMSELFPYTFRIYEAQKKTELGRWQNHDCADKTFSKVDYNNVDHCGPCGLHHTQQQIKKENRQKM